MMPGPAINLLNIEHGTSVDERDFLLTLLWSEPVTNVYRLASVSSRKRALNLLSPIGIKEPGMIGVMEPVLGEENGHLCVAKNERVSQRRQEPICGSVRP
jgi:hypothetical protein